MCEAPEVAGTQRKIQARDITGLKYFDKLGPLLKRLHDDACQRDKADHCWPAVPDLVLFSGMPIHRAMGTSLMVISLVSATGIAALVWGGRTLPLEMTGLFVVGGISGLFLAEHIARRLPGSMLQKVFAIAILAVAAFVIIRNLSA